MKIENEIEKAWSNVKSLARTSDYCKHSNGSQDLKDIARIERIVRKYVKQKEIKKK